MSSDQKLVLKDVPSWPEVEKVLGTMIRKRRQGEVSLRDLCIEGLMATTGVRVSELLALKKSDFDLKQGIMSVSQLKKKGDFVRQTVISSDLKPFLEEYLRGIQNDEKLFKLTRRQVLNITHEQTAAIIGRPIRNHAFRHAYAIRILEKTHDIELCRRLIGHSELETVKIYLDFAIGDRAKEVGDAIRITRQAAKHD